MMLAVVASLLMPIVTSALEGIRWKRLHTLAYPLPPSAPGVYALATQSHLGGTILLTPPMPVQFDSNATSQAPFNFEVRDWIEGTVRVDPAKTVSFFFRAPPGTWPSPRGNVVTESGKILTIDADGETTEDGSLTSEDDVISFRVPTEFFLRMITAKSVRGTVDGRPFTITPDEQAAFRDFAAYLKPGIAVAPPK